MRFSIRDILLLTVIVALATGWALDRWRLANKQVELNHQIAKLVEVEITRANELAIMTNRLEQTTQAYREAAVNAAYAARDEELTRRALRSLPLGRVPLRAPIEQTTESPEPDK